MTSVADNKANIVLLRKLNSSDHVVAGRDIDRIANVVAQLAGARLRGKRVTALVGKESLHNRRRRLKAGKIILDIIPSKK